MRSTLNAKSSSFGRPLRRERVSRVIARSVSRERKVSVLVMIRISGQVANRTEVRSQLTTRSDLNGET